MIDRQVASQIYIYIKLSWAAKNKRCFPYINIQWNSSRCLWPLLKFLYSCSFFLLPVQALKSPLRAPAIQSDFKFSLSWEVKKKMLQFSNLTLHTKGPIWGPTHKVYRPCPVLDAARGKAQKLKWRDFAAKKSRFNPRVLNFQNWRYRNIIWSRV